MPSSGDTTQPHNAGGRLDEAMRRHAPALRLYAAQFTADPDDLVQEAMIRLITQHPVPDNTAAWLFRVVRNLAISQLRSERARRQRERRAATERPAWFVSDNGRAEQTDRLTVALAALPDDQREIVIARLWGELTFEQVGQLVGCSSSAAHRRYDAAVDALREQLNPE